VVFKVRVDIEKCMGSYRKLAFSFLSPVNFSISLHLKPAALPRERDPIVKT
jgi:hypothetical protein